ncbi:16S rRNA (guanine(527)-N(7))-methyltransferase RsmG [Humibacillus xanthopallidus]|uniref:Ribosomal RNA small subunit methyltransferase G n=1 Tax=Humibacillus xanthopallidus TaxID=412689 RepID=A0A543H9Y9_9MICO|nr:16S rRNA (guanine(527)-N(7))-methyltransferase RsmG [Humibacillus xanthopallidus]TQM55120.1 16S rRNA m(7)G-527 methyltransferase [Humibacillus xanthopallidus]
MTPGPSTVPDDSSSGAASSAEPSSPGAASADVAVPPTPPAAEAVFGDRLGLAEEFVRVLADTGIGHGLIGPREAPRLWDRHVLNCAIAHVAIPRHGEGQEVIDVGSGAGLPGLALAIARPDLHLHLVEPLARRTGWLSGTVAELGLANVTVHTARAESLWDRISAPWVTARAVSTIVQLAEWTLPLLQPHGTLLALKGSRAREELAQGRTALTRLGAVDASVLELGTDLLEEPTTLLTVTIGDQLDRRRFRSRPPSSAGSARRRGDRRGGARRGSTPTGGDRRGPS